MKNRPGFPIEPTAVISHCGVYRYVLTRHVGLGDRTAAFIMLNPSTADGVSDDPTIRRCIGLCRRWGCGRLVVANLFGVRATDPAAIRKAGDPVGPENHDWVIQSVEWAVAPCEPAGSGPVVCAWGTHGSYLNQDLTVLGWIEGVCRPMALGVTRDGHPKHPLYVPYGAKLVPWAGRRAVRSSSDKRRGGTTKSSVKGQHREQTGRGSFVRPLYPRGIRVRETSLRDAGGCFRDFDSLGTINA